ncbi:protein PML-like isoform X2 [Heptranchias perlo]|uniref:protein PML-like isoform X2 n=1 Tax=Heptranchias perlo TaxID=212740 RepID=UPI003559C2EC
MASPVVASDGVAEMTPSNGGGAAPSAEPTSDGSSAPPGNTEETLVFFDLETTGLEKNCDIVQLSAVSGEKIFDKYTLPSNPISAGAAAINGLQVMDGILYLRGEPQPTCSLQDAMADFLQFLQTINKPLLAGHNIWKFDCPVILRAWEELSMKDQFARCVVGFLDTLQLTKDIIPRSEVNSYKQTELVKTFLNKSYEAHNAIEDVKSLQELYSVLTFTPEQKQNSQFSLSQLECRVSLQPLFDDKVLFYQLIDKLAMQEVSLKKLKSAHQQGGESGLQNLLKSLGHMAPNFTRLSNFISK